MLVDIDIIMRIFMKSLLCSKVDKPFNFFIKTSNAMEFIESDIQNIEVPRTYDLVI